VRPINKTGVLIHKISLYFHGSVSKAIFQFKLGTANACLSWTTTAFTANPKFKIQTRTGDIISSPATTHVTFATSLKDFSKHISTLSIPRFSTAYLPAI
jgi:hypothetical protein